MTGRRSIIGLFALCALCALALGALGVAGASAEQRAYMCEANTVEGQEQFSDAHCTNAATGNGGFKHVPIAEAFSAAYVASNAKTAMETKAATPAKLRSVISGVEVELECTTVSGEGSLTNAKSSVSGSGTFSYKGCLVLKPAGKGCAVTEGGFTTEPLSVTTVGQTTSNVKLSPKSGTTFTTIPISGCSISALNGKFTVSGSVKATANGATWSTTEAGVTEQGTLSWGGQKAGISGVVTVSTPLGLFAFALT